jgi:hypothetical protein
VVKYLSSVKERHGRVVKVTRALGEIHGKIESI